MPGLSEPLSQNRFRAVRAGDVEQHLPEVRAGVEIKGQKPAALSFRFDDRPQLRSEARRRFESPAVAIGQLFDRQDVSQQILKKGGASLSSLTRRQGAKNGRFAHAVSISDVIGHGIDVLPTSHVYAILIPSTACFMPA